MTICEAKRLLKSNHIIIEKNIIKINDKNYSKKEYYTLSSQLFTERRLNIRFNKNQIKLRNDLMYALFLMNVSEFTKNGVILTLIAFLLNAFISFSLGAFLRNNANFGLDANFGKIGVLLLFFASFFTVCFIALLISKIITKKLCYLGRINSYYRYCYIRGDDFTQFCEWFESENSTNHYCFSTVLTDRLLITELKTADFVQYFNCFKDPIVHKYLFSKPVNDLDEAYAIVQKEISNYFYGFLGKLAIRDKENNALIGYIGLSKMDYSKKTCQIVYALGKNYWGKGYMTEALSQFKTYLCEKGYEIIVVGHIKENVKSANVITKCSFDRNEEKDYKIIRNGVEYSIITYSYYNIK